MTAPTLADRVVMVVGAGSSGAGLSNGEAAALAYAAAGAAVAAVDRNGDEAGRVAAAIRQAGGRAVAVVADIRSESEIAAAVAEVTAVLGVPHVLHNNVGVVVTGRVTDLPVDRWNDALAVNLTGAFLTCRAVLPAMIAAGRGVVTNVSSIASIRDTGYDYPAYAAAKAGLNQLTVSIALRHAHEGIRANAILPGLIDTPLVAADLAADAAALAARHALSPTGRMGTPQDVAQVAVFLAGDAAAYVNGVLLPVDGGLSARCS